MTQRQSPTIALTPIVERDLLQDKSLQIVSALFLQAERHVKRKVVDWPSCALSHRNVELGKYVGATDIKALRVQEVVERHVPLVVFTRLHLDRKNFPFGGLDKEIHLALAVVVVVEERKPRAGKLLGDNILVHGSEVRIPCESSSPQSEA